MNYTKQDYKLLNALYALLTTKHVTKAGESVGLSQPAMSRVLQRLREIYDDDLLIRGQNGKMDLTQTAQCLIAPTQRILHDLDELFSHSTHFSPSTVDTEVIIGMSDYVAQVLLPNIVIALEKKAPKLRLFVEHLNDITDESVFTQQGIQLGIGHFPYAPKHLKKEVIFSDTLMSAAHKGNPILKNPPKTIDDFLKMKHVGINFKNNHKLSLLSLWLKQNHYSTNVMLTVSRITTAMRIAEKTDYVVTTAKRILVDCGDVYNLELFPVPMPMDNADFKTTICWHPISHNDPLQAWLRHIISAEASKLPDVGSNKKGT
ncbi:MAG: LysR family transcriptional regulator [Coxiellaceae bacterium]|nr:LysR family transcriptional regulator [Coxiellaceae bacterium]